MSNELLKRIAPQPPTGPKKWALRAPVYFYRWGLGWMMPKRLLFLTHIGRKSGQPRYVVLEVVDHDADNDVYMIVSGYGEKSQWYKNLRQTPDVHIQVGRRKLTAHAKLLASAESGQRMVDYAARYPKLARQLMSFIGYETDESEASYRKIGEAGVRFIDLSVVDAR